MFGNYTISALDAEQREVQLPGFNASIAWRIGQFIHAAAEQASMRISFEVSRPGHQLFFCAMPEVAPDSAAWIRRKRNVVERFHRSSLLMKLRVEEQGRELLERYSLSADDYCASGGGVPVMVKGCGCLGAVTVSGLTQYEDHDLAIAALRSIISDI